MKNSQTGKEIIVKIDEAPHNSAIANKHIPPENIISVIFQPAAAMAIGHYEAKYRVICRARA